MLRLIRCSALLLWAVFSPHAAEPELRWWRGNLHTHSLWSDGDGFPEMIADWYRAHSYHFLAFSDHNLLSQGQRWMDLTNILQRSRGEPWRGAGHRPSNAFSNYVERFGTNWVETRLNPTNQRVQVRLKPFDEYRAQVEVAGRFLLIQSEEITHAAADTKAIHINAINVGEHIPTQNGASVPEVINRTLRAVKDSASRTGREILVHINHPNYKWGVTAENLAAMLDENFFEVWNGVDIDNDPGDAHHPSTDELWDIANTLRIVGWNAPPLFAVATDDSHDYQGTKQRAVPGRAWVMVQAHHLTPESIVRAMRRGDFYASTGVTLKDVRFDESSRTLSLKITGRPGERFVTRFVGTRRGVSLQGRPRLDSNGNIVETTLDYRSNEGPRIGEVFKEESGRSPRYTFKGDELYVRAIVTSSRTPAVPSTEFEFQRAWTQPVGWKQLSSGQ